MKLLLDEMLSPLVAEGLRKRGHDVTAIGGDLSNQGLGDPEVLEFARAQHRAVVTNNVVDFRQLHAEMIVPGGPGHFGLVFVSARYRRSRRDIGRMVADLEKLLHEHPDETALADRETWLSSP